MAVGDALAVSLLDRRGFRPDDFAALHPAGSLGKKLLRVEHLMHAGEALPRVSKDTPMPDVFHEMSAKKLGVLASEALNVMEKRKITSIVVTDEANGVLGVVHLHDLWTLELM